MFKRFAAFAIALIFAAQLLAGVCVCSDGDKDNYAETLCCKKDDADQTSVARPMSSCCRDVCGEPLGNGVLGSVNFSSVQISAPILSAVEKLIASLKLKPSFVSNAQSSKLSGNAPKLFSKPPALYLHHHAFLI